jgi:hypothetical protein
VSLGCVLLSMLGVSGVLQAISDEQLARGRQNGQESLFFGQLSECSIQQTGTLVHLPTPPLQRAGDASYGSMGHYADPATARHLRTVSPGKTAALAAAKVHLRERVWLSSEEKRQRKVVRNAQVCKEMAARLESAAEGSGCGAGTGTSMHDAVQRDSVSVA